MDSPFPPSYIKYPLELLKQQAAAPDPEKDAADFSVESPLAGEHVYVQMAGNFPPKAIAWIRRAKWAGPVMIPWEQIDTEGKKTWAASHQPGKVKEFKAQIKAHDGHVSPSIAVRQRVGAKVFLVDGHHRALAREELGQDVLVYIGTVASAADYQQATETHSSQIHHGSDPANKAVDLVMLPKDAVGYRPGSPFRNCGNCVMFHEDSGTCDLVKGKILPGDVCDRWEAP